MSETTVEEILVKDTSFKKDLSSKRRVDREITKLRDEYDAEKNMTEEKIKSLREDLYRKRDAVNARMSALKQEIIPSLDRLAADLEKIRAEYAEKKSILKESAAKAENIKKLLTKKGDLSLSADEIAVWNKRKNELEKEIISLRKELDELRSRIDLIRTEIAILKE